jgi:hypothetical protein
LVYDQANLTAIQGELSVPRVTLQRDVDFGLAFDVMGLSGLPLQCLAYFDRRL